MRVFEVLAALALLLHLLWILWVILGWIVTLNRALLQWVHIGSLLWGILMGGRALAVPLTIAEQWLQRRAGSVSYQGSFLIHYLEAIIYPNVSQELLTWVGSGVCILILGSHARRFWQESARRTARGGE